ncbi:putative serine esterase DUF676, partial [Ancylostoma duodenale]
SMDRHRPPNFSFFELDSRRTVEIALRPAQLTAASRHIFFEHSAYALLKMTVFASLVSVLPRRKRQPPDPTVDMKSKQVHLTTGSILLQSISSIERFAIKNMKKMVTSVHIDACDVGTEMKSLKCRLEATPNPWVELEDISVSLSSRLSLLYNQLVRLCTGSSAISLMLLQNYLKFREKMLAEAFFFVENPPSELSKYTPTDKVGPSSIGPMGDSLPVLRGDPPRFYSRFAWFRRKSVNGSVTPKCAQQSERILVDLRNHCPEEHPLSTFPAEEDFSAIVDFVMEREQLKSALHEQSLFDGFLYSEQAISRLPEDEKPSMPPITHLVVFVHGLEGTCDDLSSYRNIFRITAGEIPGFYYLLSASNHSKTWSDIDEMAENLLSEVQSYSEPPMRISFVAHSLGGVIVRAAVCRDEAEWLRPRLHCLLTINSPHLGLAYVETVSFYGAALVER